MLACCRWAPYGWACVGSSSMRWTLANNSQQVAPQESCNLVSLDAGAVLPTTGFDHKSCCQVANHTASMAARRTSKRGHDHDCFLEATHTLVACSGGANSQCTCPGLSCTVQLATPCVERCTAWFVMHCSAGHTMCGHRNTTVAMCGAHGGHVSCTWGRTTWCFVLLRHTVCEHGQRSWR